MSSEKLFKNSLSYSLGILFGKASSFLLLPVYTYFLDSVEYGAATTFLSFSSTASIIVTLSLRAALIRFYSEHAVDEEKRRRFIGTIVTFVLLSALTSGILLSVFQQLYVPFFFKGYNFFPLVFGTILTLCFEAIYGIYHSLMQARQDGRSYSISNILYLLAHAVITFVFIVVFKMKAAGMIYGMAATAFLFALNGVYRMLRRGDMKLGIDRKILKRSLRYSIPILPHNLANSISTLASKLILNIQVSYSANGLYTVASQISTLMSFVQSSINLAFRPWFIEQMDKGEEGRREIRTSTVFICTVYCFVSLGIALFCQEILWIFTSPEFRISWQLVPILLLALVISFLYYSHIQTIMYNEKASKFAMVCSLTGCFSNILLCFFLAKPLNSYGVALSYLLSQAILAALTIVVSRSAGKVDFGLGKMLWKILLTAMLMGAGLVPSYLFFAHEISFLNIVFKAGVVLVSFGILFIGYHKMLFSYAKNILRKLSHRR